MRTHPATAMEALSFLSKKNQTTPGVVGVIAQVEQRWLNLALQYNALDCTTSDNLQVVPNCTTNSTKESALKDFTQSCHTVSKAIVEKSAGDRTRVQAYMSNVCSQDALKGKLEELCLDFSQYLVKEMSEYNIENNEKSMDLASVCSDFFQRGTVYRYAEQQRQAEVEEQEEKEVEEQRNADAADEAKAQAEVDAKAAVARERLEKMQNFTAEVDAKREDAVEAAVEAQRKADVSKASADVHNHLHEVAEAAFRAADDAKQKADANRMEAKQAADEAQKKAVAHQAALKEQKRLKGEADAAAKDAEDAKTKAAAKQQSTTSATVTNASVTNQTASNATASH